MHIVSMEGSSMLSFKVFSLWMTFSDHHHLKSIPVCKFWLVFAISGTSEATVFNLRQRMFTESSSLSITNSPKARVVTVTWPIFKKMEQTKAGTSRVEQIAVTNDKIPVNLCLCQMRQFCVYIYGDSFLQRLQSSGLGCRIRSGYMSRMQTILRRLHLVFANYSTWLIFV